ncbi:MAG: PD40 domain-containing protein [Ignavibacteriales bacterium]|nr:PD40 domain-containing protein [Ignavibacteriales bacterium]
MKKLILANIVFLFNTIFIIGQNEFPTLTGPYLGQTPPGMTPELFAPEIIATGFGERDITISPDGKEIFYGLLTNFNITIMQTKLVEGKWTEPEVASFAQDEQFFYLEPCFSHDGNTIYFLSTRPPEGKEPKPGWFYQNIWASDKNSDGTWGEIYNPDKTINQLNSQFYPSITKDGTIYFTRSDKKTNTSVILRSRKVDGKYLEPELLPEIINKPGTTIFNAFISPDESYLIGCVGGRESDINPGCVNYYIFFRDENDNWNEGIPFGPEINITGSNAISASVPPDGKYLFFSAQMVSDEIEKKSMDKKLSSMLEILNSPQNGNNDIYWIDAKVIEELKPKK